MGKKSVKENKNAYQNSREEAGFTRQQASELMEFISADRIEKIENERTEPHPEEILAMSKCYKDSILFRFYPSAQDYTATRLTVYHFPCTGVSSAHPAPVSA